LRKPRGLFYRKAGGQAGWGIVTNGRDGALSEASHLNRSDLSMCDRVINMTLQL